MYGTGLAKGLLLTLRHFLASYVDDLRYGFRKYHHATDNFAIRQNGPDSMRQWARGPGNDSPKRTSSFP